MRMSELLNEVRRFSLDEGFSPKEIKMAIGIASDPRYAKGNMTGAVTAIEKMKKGLSDHPQVAAVLKRQNEDVELDEKMNPFTKVLRKNKKLIDDELGNSSKDYKAYVIIDDEDLTDLSTMESERIFISLKKNKGVGYAEADMTSYFKTEKDAEQFVKDLGGPRYNNGEFGRLDIVVTPLGRGIKKEAVSMAQQAAIAISKKEKGEKPKDERDEGNEFGMALKSARDKGEKTFVVSGKKYNVTEEDKSSRIVEPYRPEFGLDEAPKMTYALVGTDMKIYAIGDEKEMNLNRRSLEKRLKDVSPLKIARLKTAQSIGDKVDKSQLKEEVEIDESMKMTDPKLLKMFDKLKSKDTVKIKYDSTLEKGTDFIEFTVKSKGTVRNGQVEKITLAAKGNPTGAKRFMYKKDGKVTFATGDMAASIVDIKESIKRALLKLESVDLDEANMNKKQMMDMITKDAKSGLGKIVHKVVDSGNRFEIQVHQDDERDAQKAMKMHPLYIAGKLRVVPALGESKVIPESNDLISQTVNLITYTQMQEKQDYADVDDDASQKDVEDAAKNIIMQLRKSVSMRGDKEVEFAAIGHGYKKKVDMKIAQKALDMYNKMKPQDKTKFQTTIAKSYKDLLNAIKGK